MTRKRILILGAGLAGLSAAWHLQKSKIDCVVFEKESLAGGLCRSKKVKDFIFDYSGHLLHFRHPHTFDFVKKLLGDNLQEHKRSAWIYSHNTFTPYPFQANFYGLPASIVKECLLGFLAALRKKAPVRINQPTFLEWIHETFGTGISRHFMVPYNTKFWTVSPKHLTCEWLKGFIPTPSLEEVIEGAIEDSGKLLGYNSHFWYPRQGGIGLLPEALQSQINNIFTNSCVCSIDIRNKEIALSNGKRENYDYLVSTLPLPEMAHLIKGLKSEIASEFRKLKWNSVFNVNLGVEKIDFDHKHWIYFPQKDICFYRVGFPHNFSSACSPAAKNSLYVELSYSPYKPLEKNNTMKRITHDLQRAGILKQNHKIYVQDTNDITYGYPMYDKWYAQSRDKIIRTLLHNNIVCCGRYGAWRYMSMEDVLRDGQCAAGYIRNHA